MNEQDKPLPSDFLETLLASHPAISDLPSDSPTTEFDAGLEDALLDEADLGSGGDLPSPGEVVADDLGEDLAVSRREIPMSDLPGAPREDFIHSSEMSDLNVPGEIDIEDLDEDSVMDALPPDARLDPLED